MSFSRTIGTCLLMLAAWALPSPALAAPSTLVGKSEPPLPTLEALHVVGGSGAEAQAHLALGGNGNIFLIGGSTESTDFPAIDAVQEHTGGGECPVGKGGSTPCDGFIAAIPPRGGSVTFSTYLGGEGGDSVAAVALDRRGGAVFAGVTDSTPLAPGVSRAPSTRSKLFLGRIDAVFEGP